VDEEFDPLFGSEHELLQAILNARPTTEDPPWKSLLRSILAHPGATQVLKFGMSALRNQDQAPIKASDARVAAETTRKAARVLAEATDIARRLSVGLRGSTDPHAVEFAEKAHMELRDAGIGLATALRWLGDLQTALPEPQRGAGVWKSDARRDAGLDLAEAFADAACIVGRGPNSDVLGFTEALRRVYEGAIGKAPAAESLREYVEAACAQERRLRA